MLIASIMAVCANAYKGTFQFKYINMLSSSTLICTLFCSTHLRPDRLRPSVMPKPISLASVNMVMLGVGITIP